MGRINLKAGDEQIEAWKAAAEREQLSFSAWARRCLTLAAQELPDAAQLETMLSRPVEVAGQGGGGQQRGDAAPGPDPPPEPDPAPEPGPPAVEAPAPTPSPEPSPSTHPELYDSGHPLAPMNVPARPDPRVKPKPKGQSLGKVLGPTVSQAQSVKAIEAARMKQERDESFSIVCPQRTQHEPGTRCPHCHGIHP